MSFITSVSVESEQVPELHAILATVEDNLELDVVIDEETLLLQDRGRRLSSWCPWPRPSLGLYVEGASTRGVELSAISQGTTVELRVTVPVLATWTDWELGVNLVCALLDSGEASAQVDGVGQFLAEGMKQQFLDQEEHYLGEVESGWEAVAAAIEEGRSIRIGGPAGYASIGERSWTRLLEECSPGEDSEERGLRMIEFIESSIERRGFEEFEEANPLVLDGPDGRRVVATLLVPGRDLILRDPEYVLLSEELEQAAGAELLLLPFERFEEAFPAVGTWLDDRCCAVPALPEADWSAILSRLAPMLIPVAELLDKPSMGDSAAGDDDPTHLDTPPPPEASSSQGRWWKFW